MSRRQYDGDPIDGTVQWITERPSIGEEAKGVVYATEPEQGEERTEKVPVPQRPDEEGQSTLDDWGWSARHSRAPSGRRSSRPPTHRPSARTSTTSTRLTGLDGDST